MKKCQTNVEHVYAIGDCAGGHLLAHKASYEGKIAAEVISGMKSAIDFQAMPFVIFSDPEVAYTGLTESEAKAKGYETIASRFPFQKQTEELYLFRTLMVLSRLSRRRTPIWC